jgi:aspartate-semialdehyde dehydrogenase
MPSLRLVQAPVFHGHSFSIWIEFLQRPDPESLLTALNQPGIDLRTAEHEPPTNVGVAGQSGITLGLIEPDRNHPNALWLWMAADGFRLVADTALQIVRSLVP